MKRRGGKSKPINLRNLNDGRKWRRKTRMQTFWKYEEVRREEKKEGEDEREREEEAYRKVNFTLIYMWSPW